MLTPRGNSNFREKGLGWVADNPDLRDYRLDNGFLDTLEPTREQRNLAVVAEILKELKPKASTDKIDNLINHLELESEKYSIFSVRYFDVLKPQVSDPKVKDVKPYLYRFLEYIRQGRTTEVHKLKELMGTRWDELNKELNEDIEGDIHEFGHKNLLQWMSSEYYDEYLTKIVKLFQVFVSQKQENELNIKVDEVIKVDGVIGIDTFKALTHWLNNGVKDLKNYRIMSPVPFPSPLPSEVLSLVLASLVPSETLASLKRQYKADFISNIIGVAIKSEALRDELLNDPYHQAQCQKYIDHRFDQLVDFIAREYYLLIEPLILVVLQFLGAIGAYKDLDYAIKMAASQFGFIINLDCERLENIVNHVQYQVKTSQQNFDIEKELETLIDDIQEQINQFKSSVKSSHSAKSKNFGTESLETLLDQLNNEINVSQLSKINSHNSLNLTGLEELMTTVDLQIFGSTEKLPDKFRLELLKEVKNLRWLQQISYWAIYQFIHRFRQEFKSDLSDTNLAQEDDLDRSLNQEISLLLQGNKSHTDTKGLVEKVIHSGLKIIGKTQKNIKQDIQNDIQDLRETGEDTSALEALAKLEGGNLTDKVDIFLYAMKKHLIEQKLFDLFESKSTIIELIDEANCPDVCENDYSNNKEAQKNNFCKKQGYINSYKEPISISHTAATYRIPVGTNLTRNFYKETKQPTNSPNRGYFAHLPNAVDLTYWCSPVSDQGSLNACTAHAGVALVEYFARQYADDLESLSIPFLYKVTRSLSNCSGNVGASSRETMRALVSVGVPPARFWAVDDANFDTEPPTFSYAVAQNYQTLSYFRIDHPDVPRDDLLTRIKIVLAAGFPCMFGFTLYESIYEDFHARRGFIPYPNQDSRSVNPLVKAVGGHAVVAVGYHNDKRVPRSGGSGYSQGAILIRNSWGPEWGIGGYGWLPYDYVLNGLTSDWWSLIKAEWLKTGRFGLGGFRDIGGKSPSNGTQSGGN